jgi:hypothetical protein
MRGRKLLKGSFFGVRAFLGSWRSLGDREPNLRNAAISERICIACELRDTTEVSHLQRRTCGSMWPDEERPLSHCRLQLHDEFISPLEALRQQPLQNEPWPAVGIPNWLWYRSSVWLGIQPLPIDPPVVLPIFIAEERTFKSFEGFIPSRLARDIAKETVGGNPPFMLW